MDLNNYFQKYKSNSLLGAISYQINIMDSMDIKIIKTVELLNKQLNLKYRKNYNINFIVLIMRLIYNSYSVISNLPHMLDKVTVDGKPCLHIIMSESIAQLVSISLSSECYHVLDEYLKKIHKKEQYILDLKKIFIKIFSDIPNINVDNLLDNSAKKDLKDHCENTRERILSNTEKLCYEYYNYMAKISKHENINKIGDITNNIEHLVN